MGAPYELGVVLTTFCSCRGQECVELYFQCPIHHHGVLLN